MPGPCSLLLFLIILFQPHTKCHRSCSWPREDVAPFFLTVSFSIHTGQFHSRSFAELCIWEKQVFSKQLSKASKARQVKISCLTGKHRRPSLCSPRQAVGRALCPGFTPYEMCGEARPSNLLGPYPVDRSTWNQTHWDWTILVVKIKFELVGPIHSGKSA